MKTPGAIKKEEMHEMRSKEKESLARVKRTKKILQPINTTEKLRFEYKPEYIANILEETFGGEAKDNRVLVEGMMIELLRDGRFSVSIKETFVIPSVDGVLSVVDKIKQFRHGLA